MNRAASKSKKKTAAKSSTAVGEKLAQNGTTTAPSAKTAGKTSKMPAATHKSAAPSKQQPSAPAKTTKTVRTPKIKAVGAPPLIISGHDDDVLKPLEPIPKMERSHSFFLTRKLSKIYNNLTSGSKENLSKIDEHTDAPPPFKFTRSLSMASIPIRQSFRRVFRENKLEKLHEENSTEKVDTAKAASVPVAPDSPQIELRRKAPATASAEGSPETRERRISFKATLKELRRTISGRSQEPELNSKWSASLASLQQIDTMVSYENLSFINYDQFNSYEKLLEKQRRGESNVPRKRAPAEVQLPPKDDGVRRRTHQRSASVSVRRDSISANNFDQPKNLFRQSLDEHKLDFLNRVNRKSFRLSNVFVRNAEDVLMLDQVDSSAAMPDVGIMRLAADALMRPRMVPIKRSRRNGCTQNQSMEDVRTLDGARWDDGDIAVGSFQCNVMANNKPPPPPSQQPPHATTRVHHQYQPPSRPLSVQQKHPPQPLPRPCQPDKKLQPKLRKSSNISCDAPGDTSKSGPITMPATSPTTICGRHGYDESSSHPRQSPSHHDAPLLGPHLDFSGTRNGQSSPIPLATSPTAIAARSPVTRTPSLSPKQFDDFPYRPRSISPKVPTSPSARTPMFVATPMPAGGQSAALPSCCLQTAKISTVASRQPAAQLANNQLPVSGQQTTTAAPPLPPLPPNKPVSPVSGTAKFNDQLRHIKQIFLSNGGAAKPNLSQTPSGAANEFINQPPHASTIITISSTGAAAATTNAATHYTVAAGPSSAGSTNPFSFGNLFKSSADKSPVSPSANPSHAGATFASASHSPLTAGPPTTQPIHPTTVTPLRRLSNALFASTDTPTARPPMAAAAAAPSPPTTSHSYHHKSATGTSSLGAISSQQQQPHQQSSTATAPSSASSSSSLLLGGVDATKREEFLRATMKICLVVSPPSNKLLQLKSKSLTHLDNLESDIGTQTEGNEKPVGDYLEVEPANTICCLSSSPPSVSSSIKKKFPSIRRNKKPILTRSQVSSSEYFCVFYDMENGCKEREEFIPAVKGTTLAEALNSALSRRNLSFSQITISDNHFPSSMDLGSPPYSGGVNQHTDVGNLAGKFLIVTEKEKAKRSSHALQKAASFGARQRPAKLFQSASTEETSEPADTKHSQFFPKHSKQRWSGLFGLRNPQQNQLYELLNHYAKHGVPQTRIPYTFDHPDLADALDYLENIPLSWTEFVCFPEMTDSQIQMQSAIWELVTTEVAYIHALQTVTDLFLACLEAIQAEQILTDVDQHKLFSNIREICETNTRFWTMYMYPMVKHSQDTGHPMCIDYAQSAFLTFDAIFSPYEKYCAEQSTCQFYCKELHRNNTLFQAYLAWCEGQKLCNRLRLADILVQPMQRLTKYSLLLRAIKKPISDEAGLVNMKAMTSAVDDFVVSVNSHLTDRQKNERIKGIMARIESYDAVDSTNETLEKLVKEHSTMFDLCGPMRGCAPTDARNLFMEGDLKFKDILGKVDVHCFLLTDMLLVCKTIAKKGLGTLKVIRQPFFTDRLVIKVKENTLFAVYMNEINMPVTAFTLQCPEAQSWHEAINKTKLVYAELKQGSTSWDDGYNIKYDISGCELLGVRKSPLNSSIGSRISSLNNSHSGSVELTESKAVSVDFEKTNSLSSDEGSMQQGGGGGGGGLFGKKVPQNSPTKMKGSTSNTLNVQQPMNLGQSLPNLNLNSPHTSHNTLLVPGSSSGHSNLLSPSHRGISYPPPSPTRATLRRGFAFSSSIKNPPLVKSRNVISQNSFNMASLLTGVGSSPVQPPPPQPSSSTSSLSGQPLGGSRAPSPVTLHQQQQQQHLVHSTPTSHQPAQKRAPPHQLHSQSPIDIEQQIQNSHESDV